MIQIAPSTPTVWPTPASGATAPVVAVTAVRPPQETARNGQSGTGAQPDTPTARADRRTEARETDRQAREAPNDAGQRTGNEPGQAADALNRQEAEENAKQLAQEQAADEARRVQRQELLTNVWEASAAVVNRILGREEAAALSPATTASTTTSTPTPTQAVSERQPLEPLPWPVMPPEANASPTPTADFPTPEEVVAYDERGNGSTAPVEAGTLVSERV